MNRPSTLSHNPYYLHNHPADPTPYPMTFAPTSKLPHYITAQTEGAVYRHTVRTARELLNAATSQILVPEDDHFALRASDPPEPTDTNHAHTFADRLLKQGLTREDTWVIDDLTDIRSTKTQTTPQPETDQYRSLLLVPNDTIGLLLAASHQPRFFTEANAEEVDQLLSYAELALDRIHTQAQRNARGEHLTEIIGTFAHDLRSPLQVATGHLTLAETTGDDESFDRVSAAHDRIAQLLDDMTRLAQSGKRVEDPQTVELQTVAEQAWTTVPTGDATLDIADSLRFDADRSRLRQLLENLFQNAADHGPADVCIRVGRLDDGFYIEDDGPGIPPADREGVFEWHTSSAEDHTGLGLSIVEQIVAAHGWEIRVGEGSMGGARFEITGVKKPSN